MGLISSILTLTWITETSLGFIGNRVDESLASKLNLIKKRVKEYLSDTDIPLNNDLQKAVECSHWLATKVFCEKLKKRNHPSDILNRIFEVANQQINLIKNKDYILNLEVNNSDIESIILGEEQNINDLLKRKILDFHIKDLSRLLNERERTHSSFENFEQNIRNGLDNLDWFNLACSFLNDSLTGDNKAKDAFNNYYLAKISKNVEENRQLLIKTMNSFVETVGEERFEEFKLLVKTDLKEIEGKIDDILNPQPTLIYDYSHQTQSENKAIFRRRYVPFVGRDAEMKQLRVFFDSENLLEWQLVTSAGGSGKSRLAMEFCYALAERNKDYQLGFYKLNDKDKIDWHKWQPFNKALIVIDYVTADYKTILEILTALYLRVNSLIYPVRFLLLEREKKGEWWKAFDACIIGGEIPKPFADTIALPPLSNNLLQIIAFCLQKANKPPPTTEKEWYEILENLRKIDPLGRPLFAFYVGLALANGETIRNWKVEDLLDNHLKREEAHFWKNEVDNNDLLEKHKNLVALATMMGGINYDVLSNILDKKYAYLPSIEEFRVDICKNLSNANDEILFPLEPDVLGEYFVHKQLQKDTNPLRNRNKAKELIGEAWRNASENMIFFVLRFYQDFLEYDEKEVFLKLPLDANEEVNFWYCSMFLDLSGTLINNGRIEEAEDFWRKVEKICIDTPSIRLLMRKSDIVNNMIAFLGQNGFFEKAEKYYIDLLTMTTIWDSQPDISNQALMNRVKAAYNLSLEFGKNNLLNKAEYYYAEILDVDAKNYSSLLNEVLTKKSKASFNLSLDFSRLDLMEKAEYYYTEITNTSVENRSVAVLSDVLCEKARTAYNLSLYFSKILSFEKAEKYYREIENMASIAHPAEVLKEVLFNKVQTIYNLIHCFAENGLFEKAEGYYDQIVLMVSYNSENQEVLKEILIWKAKATYHLSLAFGRVNIVEKSERYYGKIVEMSLENHPFDLLNEILKIRAKSLYCLVHNLGNHGLLQKAERYYFEIKEMSHKNYSPEVLKETLRNRVESALYYYKLKHFTSWQLALNWLVEELLKSYEKLQIAEIAIKIEEAFLDFYKKYRKEIPAQTDEQIKSLLFELVRLFHQDISWQPYMGLIIKDFKEFGLLPDVP